MKKLILLAALAFVLSFVSTPFAATEFTHDAAPNGDFDNTNGSAMINAYRTSTNVVLIAETDATGFEYVVASGHTQGNRIYSSGSGDAQINMTEIAAGDLPITNASIETVLGVTVANPIEEGEGG